MPWRRKWHGEEQEISFNRQDDLGRHFKARIGAKDIKTRIVFESNDDAFKFAVGNLLEPT
jgi:hypothetical protein